MKKIIRLYLYVICIAGSVAGCKKVDDHSSMVLSQPWLSDYYTQTTGSRLAPIDWKYPSTLVVGDTAMFIGNLFPYAAGTHIMIGNAEAKIVDTARFATTYTSYTPQQKLDGVRFVITKEMGVGKNRPVTITANGISIHGAPISIQLIEAGASRTDTTLWVEQIAQWTPANLNDYTDNSNFLVKHVTNDKAGNIYFSNQLSVQALRAGKVTPLISRGDALQDDKGSKFTIKQVLGSAVTFEGDAIYFSAEVLDNKADEENKYIFRLCKMNLASKTITTINRTLVANGVTTDENGAPFQGNISQLNVVAVNLYTDINEQLYYTNVYAPGSSSDHKWWYNNSSGISTGVPGVDPRDCLLLISRMDISGKVHGLMCFDYIYPSIGFKVNSGNYLHDPAGKTIYGYYTTNWIRYDMLAYNVAEDDKGDLTDTFGSSFNFLSYEKDPLYKKLSGSGYLTDPFSLQINPVMQLPDGSLLVVSNSSLAHYDLAGKIQYCYAGTEMGLDMPVAEQKQKTGLAKWVDFTGATLIGQDKSGAVYYCSGVNDTQNGVTFYKMYPKKK
jgi:hypothetical protein